MNTRIPKIRELVDALDVAHTDWSNREQSRPGARAAANTAMDSIDGILRELHSLRGELVGEIRRYDDATAERVDALLARRREDSAQ